MAEAAPERPEGLRPGQSSANSCENIRLHGRCKFGNDCYYAHSQEESELFAQWARTQKVGARALGEGSRAHSSTAPASTGRPGGWAWAGGATAVASC